MRVTGLIIVMALALSGCVRTRTIEFSVPPPETQSNAGWAQMVAVTVSVSDKRMDKATIGRASAGSSMEQYVVQSGTNMEEAVKRGLLSELKARGVQRFDGPSFISVDINKANSFTQIAPFNIDVEASAELSATVVGSDGNVRYQQIYRRSETGKGEVWTMSTVEQGAFRLQKVVAALIREMVDDERLIQALIAANREGPK